jgi:ribosome biogenesis GTPase
VRLADGALLDCTLRGKFRLEGLKTTNPVAVGDRVVVDDTEDGSPVIAEILPRHNYILRRSTKLSSQVQMLCANVDQAVLVVTVVRPFTPLGYIDRFLVMCEAYHVPVVIVFNKYDLVEQDEKEREKLLDFEFLYRKIGYATHVLNALDKTNAAAMQQLFAGKVTFIGGVSGSGKSTLANLADETLNLKTGVISDYSEKGRHTTTFAEMYALQSGGYVIDAPGFKEFDVVDITRQELSHYFIDMRRFIADCRFNNCTHTNEPGCAVKAALEKEELFESRYHTYLNILESIPTNFQK